VAVRARTSRKILVASMGVATVSYVISCGGAFTSNEDGGSDANTVDEHPVANLAVRDATPIDHMMTNEGGSDGEPPADSKPDTIDDFPVANLVAVDVLPPKDVGPPLDVTPPKDVSPPKDAKVKDTIDEFPVANLVVHPG